MLALPYTAPSQLFSSSIPSELISKIGFENTLWGGGGHIVSLGKAGCGWDVHDCETLPHSQFLSDS